MLPTPGGTGDRTIILRATVDGVQRELTVTAGPGFTTAGPGAVTFGTTKLDAYRLQQRLRFLGYPKADGAPLAPNGVFDADTQWAVGLFNAATAGGALTPTTAVRRDFINSTDAPGGRN